MKENYYVKNLSGARLLQVYETGIPRVVQYLRREIDFVRERLRTSDNVLELAAGYGRIMKELAPFVKSIAGIDISDENVLYGREYLKDAPNAELTVMDVHKIDFADKFDAVLCLQNGLSAVKAVAPEELLVKILRSLRSGGKAYFSTYHPDFWEGRVAWFKEQADKGLLGELDLERTKDGVIICKDGFRATTQSREYLEKLGRSSQLRWQIEEVDGSSLFLIIQK